MVLFQVFLYPKYEPATCIIRYSFSVPVVESYSDRTQSKQLILNTPFAYATMQHSISFNCVTHEKKCIA